MREREQSFDFFRFLFIPIFPLFVLEKRERVFSFLIFCGAQDFFVCFTVRGSYKQMSMMKKTIEIEKKKLDSPQRRRGRALRRRSGCGCISARLAPE